MVFQVVFIHFPVLFTILLTKLLGGRQGKVPVDAFEVFDFKESLWKRLPNIPTKRVFSLYSCSDQQVILNLGYYITNDKLPLIIRPSISTPVCSDNKSSTVDIYVKIVRPKTVLFYLNNIFILLF